MSESLSAQAIKEIERMALAAKQTRFVHPTNEPKGYYAQVKPDGDVEYIWAEPSPLKDQLKTPEAFLEYVEGVKGGEDSRVYYDESQLVFISDMTTRRDRATCKLIPSPQLTWLQSGSKQSYRQADFVRLLRVDLRGTLPAASNLLPLVRELRFNANAAASGSIQHGKESMGRQIDAAVHGAEAIPEEVTLALPVWENYSFIARVQCAVEVLPHEQQFRLTPYPLELRTAIEEGMAAIRGLLDQAKDVPVYYGNPG